MEEINIICLKKRNKNQNINKKKKNYCETKKLK